MAPLRHFAPVNTLVPDSFDIVDLSLADSTGLSNAGGNTIYEKYDYTREAMASFMRTLKPGGILAVTIWNKEDPPKSAIRVTPIT